MDTTSLAIIEWHDGTLARIEPYSGGVRLYFSLVFLYRQVATEEYDIETGPALLNLSGGTFPASKVDRWVADCLVEGPCHEDDIQALLRGIGPGKCRLILTDGTDVQTPFAAAKVELVGPFSVFEHWSGPLTTPAAP